MKKIALINFVIFLASCASSTDMSEALQSGVDGIPTHQFSDANTVEEIRKLRPQAKPPIKVAVIPPHRWKSVSVEERKIIEKWGEKLKETGFVKSMEIVPQSLRSNCNYRSDSGCYLQESRLAGARLRADAILFLNDSTVTDQYVNPASILNLTIVGMWFVPAHHRDSYSVYEASLFDIDNGYLYTVAEGYGEHKTVRPYMYTDWTTGKEEARLEALEKLGERLLAKAQESVK
ncbi:hypothetical protein [Microbulbifer rhizosphaerae]|uniref:Rhombotail lipoprotein n=1 Tax=Microbulbifer rhizosphaerae TaxID=1562603 RepID=A0A7W4WA01_9GAMM|nr:hypothetical protein [Microbulbifer rhizosphaerae]MBB3060437.1 rhombotail lipoprotein [Microbulbifer rhizosphaerae]